MDIKVSSVPPMFVNEIDKKAKKISNRLGRKFSRNDYIKMLIQNDFDLELVKFKEDKFDNAVDNLTITLARQEEVLQKYIDSNAQLFNLLASGIEE